MKKVRLGIMALVLTSGIVAAFATSSKGSSGKFVNFNWQTSDASGNIVTVADGGVYDPNRSLAQAKSDFGCSGTAADCAVTVPSQDTPPNPGATYIKHN